MQLFFFFFFFVNTVSSETIVILHHVHNGASSDFKTLQLHVDDMCIYNNSVKK